MTPSRQSASTIAVNGRTRPIENGGQTSLAPARSLDALAATIRHEHDLVVKAGQKMLDHAVLCGEALLEAKPRVPKGTWQGWLDENVSFARSTANFYMRCAAYVDLLREEGLDSVASARAFLRQHELTVGRKNLSPEQREEIRRLHADGLGGDSIAELLGIPKATVHENIRDPLVGTRRGRRAPRRKGRRPAQFRAPITDDLVEGMAAWLVSSFGAPGRKVTDRDRDLATEALRAAFTYDGPIPGE